jgi:hypothetical protein
MRGMGSEYSMASGDAGLNNLWLSIDLSVSESVSESGVELLKTDTDSDTDPDGLFYHRRKSQARSTWKY